MIRSLRVRLTAARHVLAGRPLIYRIDWRNVPTFHVVEGNGLLVADCDFHPQAGAIVELVGI